MRILDRWHLDYPFAGSRMLRDMLRLAGHRIGRKHVATLMGKMGIEALYRKANTSGRHPAHRIYPYLLRGLVINQPNQVWAMDTTYIPMRQGFVYLTAVLDWASRRVLAWRVSNSLAADSCVEALEEAIHRYGAPQIMNTDQGSQYTSSAFIGVLESNGIRISMDGKGCWRDNVFVERRSTCTATTALPPPRPALPATSPSTTVAGRIKALTARPRTRFTSTRRRSPRRLNPAELTYKFLKTVQLRGATSLPPMHFLALARCEYPTVAGMLQFWRDAEQPIV